MVSRRGTALRAAGQVCDPELPMLTLEDLGVLREVRETAAGVVVTVTPTYSGCPALETIRGDLVRALHDAGFPHVEVRTALHPPWSTDRISERGRRRLAEAGIAPPGPAPPQGGGPIPLDLGTTRRRVHCPLCASPDTERISPFSATACKSLHRCLACLEPFEHFKEL